MKLSEIARIVGGTVAGDGEVEIHRLAKIEDAVSGDITFLANPKYRKHVSTTGATALLAGTDLPFDELDGRVPPLHLVRVADPYLSFLKLVDVFYPAAAPPPTGTHPTAVVSASSRIGPDVAIGPSVVIGDRCAVGQGTVLHPGVVLGEGCEIGEQSTIYPNVTIREGCRLGKRVIVHSGTVIGSDGFGFAPTEDGSFEKVPQRGIVVIEDDVEIGSNCSIDRATIGETRIKRGAKLDNLIQVAHNVVIGEDTVIAAQTGISGTTKIGKNCMIAGQVGFVGHIQIADRTTIGAQSGVSKSISESGKMYFGYPAREIRESKRIEASLRQLPELIREIQGLQRRIDELEAKVKESGNPHQPR